MSENAEKTVKKNELATASMYLGIGAVVLGFLVHGWIGILGGIAAVILGFISIGQIKKLGQSNKSNAIIGIILGFVGLLWGILPVILAPAINDVFDNIGATLDDI